MYRIFQESCLMYDSTSNPLDVSSGDLHGLPAELGGECRQLWLVCLLRTCPNNATESDRIPLPCLCLLEGDFLSWKYRMNCGSIVQEAWPLSCGIDLCKKPQYSCMTGQEGPLSILRFMSREVRQSSVLETNALKSLYICPYATRKADIRFVKAVPLGR